MLNPHTHDDLEVKRKIKVYTTSIKEEIWERLEPLISEWKWMKRVVAWILNCKKIFSSRVGKNAVKSIPTVGLDVSLLEERHHEIIRREAKAQSCISRLKLKPQAQNSCTRLKLKAHNQGWISMQKLKKRWNPKLQAEGQVSRARLKFKAQAEDVSTNL